MKPARVIILSVALLAAGAAAFLAMNLTGRETVVQMQAETVVKKEPVINVLVASANLPVGSRLTEESMRWQGFPENGIVEGFITEQNRPKALDELKDAIIRMPVFEGEPIRAEKIADANSAVMSSLLPSGKRAVATEITVSTSAGGFILPNDRVDVLRVMRDEAARGNEYITEAILTNVRVLAIGQALTDKNAQGTAVGSNTATLELSPRQVEQIISAQRMGGGTLTLALRSALDLNRKEEEREDETAAAALQVVRFGQTASR